MELPSYLNKLIAGCILMLAFASSQLKAVEVFSDNFDDGLANWHFYNTAGAGTAWSNPSYDNPPMSGKIMYNYGGTASNTKPLAQWSTVELSQIGDSITVSFDVLINSTNGNQGLQVALFNTETALSGNYIGTNLGYTPVSDSNGYVIQQYYSTTETGLQYRDLSANSAATLSTQQPVANIGNNTINNVTITLTIVADGLQIDYSSAGNTYDSYVDTTPTSYSFNTIQFQTGEITRIDNLVVTTTVPESSSSALLIGIASLLALLSRRHFSKTR